MDLLAVIDVAAFCPWDAEDLAELEGIGDWLLPRRHRVRDWRFVAETSASAVDDGLGDEELDVRAWLDYGRSAGLRGADLEGYASLHYDPIMVSPNQWTNGRHRGWLIQKSGARRTAIGNPEWCHPSWRQLDTPGGATGPLVVRVGPSTSLTGRPRPETSH